jgi:hypothetical protein
VWYSRWQEEGNRVQRSINADGDEHVNVNLPVEESGFGVFEVKFISQGTAISFQSTLDLGALLLGEKSGTLKRVSMAIATPKPVLSRSKEYSRARIIIDCPIGDASDHKGQNTLEDENP